MVNSSYEFEQGPIRPPSESGSLLVRVTRNCPWNYCTFCPVYKRKKFSIRSLDHVIRDIDTVGYYVDKIKKVIEKGETFSHKNFRDILTHTDTKNQEALHAALNFVQNGMKSIFLQDGNSLIIKPNDVLKILSYIKETFPKVIRVTTYARSHTIARISSKNLKLFAGAGLNRIHIGMESGSDEVLKLVKKGVTKSTQILAGQKIKQAGIQLSEYYMPGLGGKILTRENAIETADALNQINPDFIRLRTLAIRKNTLLWKDYEKGNFERMGEVDTVREILTFIKNLNKINSTVKSDHILNLLTEVEGVLPKDKDRIIGDINTFLDLDPKTKMVFCLGRRTNRITRLTDLNDPVKYNISLELCHKLGATPENMDEILELIIQRFV